MEVRLVVHTDTTGPVAVGVERGLRDPGRLTEAAAGPSHPVLEMLEVRADRFRGAPGVIVEETPVEIGPAKREESFPEVEAVPVGSEP